MDPSPIIAQEKRMTIKKNDPELGPECRFAFIDKMKLNNGHKGK